MIPRRQDVAEKVCLGDQLQTQREADNPHDSNAVQLLYDGQELGYVPARHAVWVAEILDNNRPLRIEVSQIRAGGDARQVELYLDTRILTDMDAF